MTIGNGNFAIKRLRRTAEAETRTENLATRKGVALKTLLFSGIAILSAVLTYVTVTVALKGDNLNIGVLSGLLIGSAVLSMISAVVCMFSVKATPIAGSVYALSEGFFLGFLSLLIELWLPGVVFAALFATAGVFITMSILYYTGLIKVSNRFRSIVMTALISMIFVSLMLMLFSFFIPAFTMTGTYFAISIAVSAIMVVIASLMLLVDFRAIDDLVEAGLGKEYEWVGAFSLTVTLIWLYAEILRLLTMIAAATRR